MSADGYDNKDHEQAPSEAQLQAQLEGQLQGQGQLQGEGQLQGQGQHQGQGEWQSSESDNSNCNANGNLNANGNFNANGNLNANCNDNHNANCNTNENVNVNQTCVDVKVDVSANLTPVVGEENQGSVIYIPQTFNQYIEGGQSGDGAQTQIALDQINNLTANNTADGNYISNTAPYDGYAGIDGASNHVGDISQGDLASGVMNANTSNSATLDAFTQSIVLGANIQSNAFTMTLTGHDSHVETHHS